MQLVHHRHSLVMVGAGHLPGSFNHRFLAASGIVPPDGTWIPAQEVLSEREARIEYHNGFWLHVLPHRVTFCQETALPGVDPRTESLATFDDIAEGYHETFPRIAHQSLGLNVDLMLDADPRRLLPGLLAEPRRWVLGGDEPFGMKLIQHYHLPDGVLIITLQPAALNLPPPTGPQPKLAAIAHAEIDLADGLSRAQLRSALKRLPVYRARLLDLLDQLMH